MFPYKIEYTT